MLLEKNVKETLNIAEKDGNKICASRTKTSQETECTATQASCSYTYSYGAEKKTLDLECECTWNSTEIRVCFSN